MLPVSEAIKEGSGQADPGVDMAVDLDLTAAETNFSAVTSVEKRTREAGVVKLLEPPSTTRGGKPQP